MEEFFGKVVLITGAASGIGRATASAFAQQGARLVLADVNAEAGELTAESLRRDGSEIVFVPTDVSSAGECEAMVDRALAEFGRLDVACNNAGISATHLAPIQTYELEVWDRVVSTNLSGVFYCIRHEIPALLSSGGGAIVNTASVLGEAAFPGTAAYTASKHGVLGLTKIVAIEYAAQGIRCNAVAPGIVDTPMLRNVAPTSEESTPLLPIIPAGRFGTPEEIAHAIVWLSSPQASYVNGAFLPADGGYLTR